MKDLTLESNLLKSLAHPVRLRILRGLMMKTRCNVSRMAEKLALPQSTVSQHLGVLRMCGVINAVKEGVNTCYEIRDSRAVRIMKILEIQGD